MTEDLITPENVSVQTLRAILDAAFVEYEIDSDGDICVKDKLHAYVFPSAEKSKIRFMTHFRFNDSASIAEQLECANKINLQYVMVRASARNGGLKFDYDLMIEGGISKKVFVLALKRFCSIPHAAVSDLADALIA